MRVPSALARRLICGLLLAAACAGAADAAQIAARRYTVEEGLANNYVSHIYQDSRGYIWFGTQEGLSRFDGERLVSYSTADGLPKSTITAIVEDARGRLWVATRYGGMSRLLDEPSEQPRAGGPRIRFATSQVGPGAANNVSALLADPDGSIWALSYGGLFRLRLEGDRFTVTPVAAISEKGGDLRAFADRGGRLWFASDRELVLVDHGQLRRFTAADGIGTSWIVAIAQSRAGRIFAANIDHLFELMEDGGAMRWRPVPVALEPREEFRSLLVDARDELWIGTTAGLLSAPASHVPLVSRVATFEATVETLFEDRTRNLWIGTDQAGAWLIPPERILSYQRQDGLPSSYVRRVQESADGRIFVATDGGVAQIDAGTARLLADPAGIRQEDIRTHILLDRHGVWWMSDRHGLWRVRDALLRTKPELMYAVHHDDGSPGPRPYEDASGRLWFDGENGVLYRVDDPTAKVLTQAPVPIGRDQRIWTIGWMGEQPAGHLWVGSYGFLGRLTANGFVIVEAPGPVLPRAIYPDSRGWLWIGTRYDGVWVTRNPAAAAPAFSHYSIEQGLGSTAIWTITEDRSGRMYFGTGRGLDRLDVMTGAIRHFGTGDGLAGTIVTDSLRDQSGRLWIGTSTGVSLLVPEPPAAQPGPGAVLFTRVRAGGQELAVPDRGTARISPAPLDPSRPELLAEFVVPGTRGLRYEYRLGGADARWTEVAADRVLNLARLSPGGYTLLVRAAAADGGAPGPAAQMDFEVLRPFWQRPWFAASSFFGLTLVLFGLHRMRVRQLLAVERVRQQVALDLHDDIGSGLARIAVLSEVAKRDAAPAAVGMLDETAGVARAMRESMSDIVWAIDPRRDTVADLVQRMRQAAFDLLEPQGLRVRFVAPEDRVLDDIALAPDRRRHLLLILKEAITNIARHARASSVDIELSLEHRRLRLHVRDDGAGFDARVPSGGTGLHSFQTRAREIGGMATLESSPGRGTTLDVVAPLA